VTMRKLIWIVVLMFTWPAHAELPPCPKTLNPGQLPTYPAKKCLLRGCLPGHETNCAMTGPHVCIPGKGCLNLGPYDENGNERAR
jgi:hypothetical protein